MSIYGFRVDLIAVYKDGSEQKCHISGNQLLGARDINNIRPWKFHVKECDREHIDKRRMHMLDSACHPQSIYDYGERVVFA